MAEKTILEANKNIQSLTVGEFASIFDIAEEVIPAACVKIIESNDFRYECLDQAERDKIIIALLRKIGKKKFCVSGEDNKGTWERGWGEILERFKNSGYDTKSLIPQYNRDGSPIRLKGDYVKMVDGHFETHFIELLRTLIFEQYIKDKDCVYEFGCGTAYNLLSFAEKDPHKYYYGCDWVAQPKMIIDLIREHLHYNIYGGVFDMFRPDDAMEIKVNSVSVTIGSLEQLGRQYQAFLQFLLRKPFALHVHINSILELYDADNNIMDYVAYRFEVARNYLNGYFTTLRRLERDGLIRILKMHRVPCGGLYGDGYSITVWQKI